MLMDGQLFEKNIIHCMHNSHFPDKDSYYKKGVWRLIFSWNKLSLAESLYK